MLDIEADELVRKPAWLEGSRALPRYFVGVPATWETRTKFWLHPDKANNGRSLSFLSFKYQKKKNIIHEM